MLVYTSTWRKLIVERKVHVTIYLKASVSIVAHLAMTTSRKSCSLILQNAEMPSKLFIEKGNKLQHKQNPPIVLLHAHANTSTVAQLEATRSWKSSKSNNNGCSCVGTPQHVEKTNSSKKTTHFAVYLKANVSIVTQLVMIRSWKSGKTPKSKNATNF